MSIKNLLSKNKKLKILVLAGVVGAVIIIAAASMVFNWQMVLAATYDWRQSILSLGGQGWVTSTSTNASHLANQTNWQYFASKDANVSTSTDGVSLSLATSTWLTTSQSDFLTSGYSASSTLNIRNYGNATSSVQGAISLLICGNSTYGKVDDVDNNTYNTVKIGTQCWMKENMRTTKYPNGSAITRGPTTTWSASDLSYYGCPPNTDNNAEDCAAVSTLGYMYQWSAAMNNTTTAGAQGICPSGWHIPTDGEQNTLDQYLKTGTCDANRSGLWDCDPAGTKLSSYTLNGTNSSGFSGLLAGYRNTASPWFYGRGTYTYFWSSAQSGSNAWYRLLYSSYSTVYRNANTKAYGFSVRCLKD